MRNRLIIFVLGILALLLVMCRALPYAEQTLVTESLTITLISSPFAPIPTLTIQSPTHTNPPEPTATPFPPTATPTLDPTFTPALEFVPVGDVCLPEDDSVSIDSEVLMYPDFEELIAAYLSAGGVVSELENTFALQNSSGEDYLVRVFAYDITADSILDVLMILTTPYGNGLGESHVLAFRCVVGGYESDILFRRAGAGARAEGLYAGGGAAIIGLHDLNADSIPDIFIEVNWPGYQEYYLLEWDGADYKSLIYYVDILGMEKYRLEITDGNVQLMDIDEDSVFELEVTGIDSKVGSMTTVIWRWNGKAFSPEE